MPTGPVTWDTIIWLVTVLIGAISGASTVLWMGWRFYRSLVTRIDIEAARAKLAEERLERMINEAAQHVAETYATKSGVTVAVERVESAVQQLSGQVQTSVDRLSERIDRLLEIQAAPTAPPRRRSTT